MLLLMKVSFDNESMKHIFLITAYFTQVIMSYVYIPFILGCKRYLRNFSAGKTQQ